MEEPTELRAATGPHTGDEGSPPAAGPRLRFRATIRIDKINPYVLVSAGQAARLKPAWRKPMPVRVQVDGKPEVPWRINLMPVGNGSFFLYLHGKVRKASGTGVGDVVSLKVEFDDEYRGGPTEPLPSWFSHALNGHADAQAGWNRLPPSRQKEIVRHLVGLKSEDARLRNTRKALHVLAGGEARFMARSWNVRDHD